MILSVLGALAAAATAIYDKAMDKDHPLAFYVIVALLIGYGLLVLLGFAFRKPHSPAAVAADDGAH
jgi:hypothetical protein